ncbi:MAG TPA: oligosaccharide flippase family protein, partial [Chloroflexota bacterium]
MAAVPLYLHFLGVEAYGLVGFYATMQSIFALLDMGLGTTATRELARLSSDEGAGQEARNLVRTLEIVYWAIAALLGLLVLAFLPLFGDRLVNAQALSPESVRQSLTLMGLATACQFPLGLYSGGLIGLQRQVLLNALSVAAVIAATGGALLILWLVSPTVQAFFAWEASVNLLQTVATGICLWRSLPAGQAARFRRQLLARTWRFAAVMGVTSVLGAIRGQMDKLILIKLVPLEAFGYYSLAAVVASGLFFLASPVQIAAYPRFSQQAAVEDLDGIRHLYHHSSQLASVLVLPAAVVAALFAQPLLLLWTQNPA